MGIADQVRDAIATESGKSADDCAKQIWCVDKPGLLLQSLGEELSSGQKPFARSDQEWEGKEHKNLLSVIKEVKPHVLIGTSTKPKAFTEEVVKEMAKHVDRPIIFPLSNPTRLHEADPKDIYEWTEGKALIATGSPFPPVKYNGRRYEVGKYYLVQGQKPADGSLIRAQLANNKVQLNATIPPRSPALG